MTDQFDHETATPAEVPDSTKSAEENRRPRVVIIGGGFAGLNCALALGEADIDVLVIDRRNYSLFTPLLYQVATAALPPSSISEPIRRSLGRFRNTKVAMAEVTGVDLVTRRISLKDGGTEPFDYLVLATGSVYNYFGHDDWAEHAPGLKTVNEARVIRQRLLTSYEQAELCDNPAERRRLLTHVVIGGGPTGVEMAGALADLGREIIARDFRRIDPEELNVVLVEGGPRLLMAFPESLATYAHNMLEQRGVTIRLNCMVKELLDGRVETDQGVIEAACTVWGAGVRASDAAEWIGVTPGRGNRLPVAADLSVEGLDRVYAIGDTSAAVGADGKPLPQLAQVAKQQGKHLGAGLRRLIRKGTPLTPFHFHDRGNVAIIGRHAAIIDFGWLRVRGFLAWYLWAIVHVYLLVNIEQRLMVSLQWFWRYLTHQVGARLIDETPPQMNAGKKPEKSRA